jgi:hypothetical protein
MGRLIELHDAPELPASLTVGLGDVLRFGASGGRVRSGKDVVEMLGPFMPAVLGTNGEILSPMGVPNTLLCVARRSGTAVVEIVGGFPWRESETAVVEIKVETS